MCESLKVHSALRGERNGPGPTSEDECMHSLPHTDLRVSLVGSVTGVISGREVGWATSEAVSSR